MAPTGKPWMTMALLIALATAAAVSAQKILPEEEDQKDRDIADGPLAMDSAGPMVRDRIKPEEEDQDKEVAQGQEVWRSRCDVSMYVSVCEQAANQDSPDAKLNDVCCKTIAGKPDCECSLRSWLVEHGYVDNKDGKKMQAISCVPAKSCPLV